ncbi:MAG TPA: hypothetical protein VGB74_15790 [Actinoplanes sp.]|jgi:hypothetical protein
MPGYKDIEAIAVYPANPGDDFRVPTVEKAQGFDVRLEAEAGSGRIGPDSVTPYSASIQILNLSRFRQVTVTTAAPNASGNIGKGELWNTNDQRFVFKVAADSVDLNVGDFVQVLATVRAGNPRGDATNDFSYATSELFQVI